MQSAERIDYAKTFAKKFEFTCIVGPLLNREIIAFKGARISKSLEVLQQIRTYTVSVLSAELFADRETPEFLVAESEEETHDDLREKHPSREKRISGELVSTRNPNFRFFQFDSVLLGKATTLPVDRNFEELLFWLAEQNIVPLDAEGKVILPENI